MEDYIDFPCSGDWLDHYNKQGLTPRTSGRADREITTMLKRIQKLEEQNAELLSLLKEVMTRSDGEKSEKKATKLNLTSTTFLEG